MSPYHVWVSPVRTLDITVEADSQDEAQPVVRTRLSEASDARSWLDSATVIHSVLEPAASNAEPRRDFSTFPPSQQLLNTTDAAKYLGISRTKVYELISSGSLESITIGRSRRVSVAQLQRFLESQS